MEPIDPALYDRDDLRAALQAHRFGPVFDAVNTEAGLSYREIGRRTGCHESVIDAIRKGRIVESYPVLERITEGLGIPRDAAGLGYGTYPEQVTVADSKEAERMLRRHLLAQGGVAIAGATVAKLGALLGELPGPPPVPLPTRVDWVHVVQVQDMTRRLGLGETYSDPETIGAAAELATRLLGVPGAEPVKRCLMTAVAELHSAAGWAAHDAGLYDRTLYHHARSLDLATDAGDAYLQALALMYGGLAAVEHGHPNDGLKMAQCAQVKTWEIPRTDQRTVLVGEHGRGAVEASVLDVCATALGSMGDLDIAVTTLTRGRALWTPAPADPFGDMDRPAACLELSRGRLDLAEQCAVASVRRWERGRKLSRTSSAAVLATVYVTAGDSRGLPMAHRTITDMGKLRSVRARRQWLPPLADALDARPGADARDLARRARQVATTRV